MTHPSSRPAPLRLVAAALTFTTATFLMVQLMRDGHADEAAPPTPVVLARATAPEVRAEPTAQDTVLPAMPAPKPIKKKGRSRLRDFLSVKDMGGY